MLQGVFTALVTPFGKDGSVNLEALRSLVELQREARVDGLVPCATTGESPALSDEERRKIVSTVIEAAGSAKVIVGAGTNNTERSVAMAREAKDLGADGILSVCPYYNKPTQKGMYEHFRAIASVGLPVVVYNVPGRTGCSVSVNTLMDLSALENIAGVKDATGDIQQTMSIIERAPENFSVLSGDDALTYPIISLGGDGVVSVASNLVPKDVVSMVRAALDGRYAEAREIHYRLMPLFRALFIETNPIPVKEAMNLCGINVGGFRLPLCTMEEKNREALREVLRSMNIMRL